MVIHISTASIVHSRAGADQAFSPNHPQACAQAVIVAGQGLQVSVTQGRKPVQPLLPVPAGAGGDPDAHHLLARGGPGQVFAARGRDLASDQP